MREVGECQADGKSVAAALCDVEGDETGEGP